MLVTLRILLVLLGLSAIAIAASILVLGAQETAWMAERALMPVLHAPPSEPWPPTMDSELRFYAALWAAYGVIATITAVRIAAWGRLVPWLALVFFAGGAGRVASYVQVGAPHPFFVLLMAIELGLPPVLILLWLRSRRP